MVDIIEKEARFIDNKGNRHSAKITINPDVFIGIETFDQNNIQTGYIRVFFHPNNRFYLDVIYCLDEYRGNGIATMLSNLADYIMRDYEGYVIRGVYKPTQMWTDRSNNIVRSESDLDTAARQFYAKNGYEVINYEDFVKEPEKYPYIANTDFQRGEEEAETIVAKVVMPREYPFVESGGVIYSSDYEPCKQKAL